MEAASAAATQYLTFKLDEGLFAFDIGKVREVLDFSTPTKMPRMPDFMRGVINLRGTVVPVIDLRLKFQMTKTEKTVNTCVIITEVIIDGQQSLLGVLADSVQEVLDLDPGSIEQTPSLGTNIRTEFITGMGCHNDAFIMILDIDRIFSTDELAAVQTHGEAGA